ncbi:hypothetical protein ONE63_007278 [Megalurothrips usitatus]|uniref:Ionotropic glutamate receptor C-terminal domain-containing protein n=1 Tax=Megalurothrips usitatus TaxID=439358 RepID=A0AAV7XUU6_9NEOP|nr:hypothetical protein ONE63_007278 [Megalurothrips usitatus]
MVSATLVGSPLARPIHGHPTRAFLCCWLFVGIVVCTGYLASLKSIVAVPSEPRPIRDVEELADHTEIPLCK